MVYGNLLSRLSSLAVISSFLFIGASISRAQTSATVSESGAEITAGDEITVKLKFDVPATCDRHVSIFLWHLGVETRDIALNGELSTGKSEASLRGRAALDDEGIFSSNQPGYQMPQIGPCPGYSVSKKIDMEAVVVHVKGVPDTNSQPQKAEASLSLTQRQFLDTKSAELSSLSSQIDTRIDADGRDTVELHNFLAGIVAKAEQQLTITEKAYRVQILRNDEALPLFFADFRKQYLDRRTELHQTSSSTQSSIKPLEHVVYVQQKLQKRPPSKSVPRSGNISGTAPPLATAIKSLVEDNAAAYKIVEQRGSHPTFHATFRSFPDGATMFYRQAILPDFKEWSKPTNIDGADFPLATFVFMFVKAECTSRPVKTVDPYDNTNPEISVEFTGCKR